MVTIYEKIKNRIDELRIFIQKIKSLDKEDDAPGLGLINSGDPWLIQVGTSMIPTGYKTKGYRKAELCKEYNIPFDAACDYERKTKDIMEVVITELSQILKDNQDNTCEDCSSFDTKGRFFHKNDYKIYRCGTYGIYNHQTNGCINYKKEE